MTLIYPQKKSLLFIYINVYIIFECSKRGDYFVI